MAGILPEILLTVLFMMTLAILSSLLEKSECSFCWTEGKLERESSIAQVYMVSAVSVLLSH